jgi:hypothetical protein
MARHLPAADAAMKQGKWEKKKFLGERCATRRSASPVWDAIGQEVARRAAAFGMRLVAHDPFVSAAVAASLGVELVSLDDVFARADYVSLHLPSTAQTRHLVNAERLARARKGIRIVNTARGDLIDETALADAIEAGHVAWRRPRRVRQGTDGGPPAPDAAAGGGDAAHRRLHARRPGAGGRGDRRRRCAISCATASSATRSTSRRCPPKSSRSCSRSWRSARSSARSSRR